MRRHQTWLPLLLASAMPCHAASAAEPADTLRQRLVQAVTEGDTVLSEDFAKGTADGWQVLGGNWRAMRASEGPAGYREDRAAMDVLGVWTKAPVFDLSDVSLSVEARRFTGSPGALLLGLRFRNPGNHYELEYLWRSNRIRINKVKAGHKQVLAEAEFGKNTKRIVKYFRAPATPLKFVAAGSLLLGFYDGEPVVHAVDRDFTTGGVALGASGVGVQYEKLIVRRAALSSLPPGAAQAPVLRIAGLRPVYSRDEGAGNLSITVRNVGQENLQDLILRVSAVSKRIFVHPLAQSPVGRLAKGVSRSIEVPFDPVGLKSGEYILRGRLLRGERVLAEGSAPTTVVRPFNPEGMNVMAWTYVTGDGARRLAEAGVTLAGVKSAAQAVELRRLGMKCYFAATIHDLASTLGSAHKGYAVSGHRIGSELHPDFQTGAIGLATSAARTYRDAPGITHCLLNTEVEYMQGPCTCEACETHYGKTLGFARPAIAKPAVLGAHWASVTERYPDGIVDDGDEVYRFYRWFYLEGGAFNQMTCKMAAVVRGIMPNVTPLHDPVLRAPPMHGRWQGLRLLNHWTYVERNPLAVLLDTDMLVCLARKSHWEQQVSQMIQVIAKRRNAVSVRLDEAPERFRMAYCVAIPPDVLTEATWLVFSRPVDMVAYHGLRTALPHRGFAYSYTNPYTLDALGRVTRELVQPYGPALRGIKTQTGPRVALLMSSVNVIFWTRLWPRAINAFQAPLTAARIPVDVIYDQDVRDGALDRYQVLAVPGRYLPRSVHEKVLAFRERGGTVLLDPEHGKESPSFAVPGAVTLAGDQPDGETLKGQAAAPKTAEEADDVHRSDQDLDSVNADRALRVRAAAIRRLVLSRLGKPLFVDSTNPYVVLNVRQSGELHYVFAVNDRRKAGPYLGKYGAVLDLGVAISAPLVFSERPGVLYDAMGQRRLVLADREAGAGVTLAVGPGWGRLLVTAPEPIGRVGLELAPEQTRDNPVSMQVQVAYASGRTVRGVVPLRVEIMTPNGCRNDFSRYAATDAAGRWSLSFPIARNESVGSWQVRVRELIAGNEVDAFFTLVD